MMRFKGARKKVLLATVLALLAVLLLGGFLYIRSPFVSNHLKRAILPELSQMLGQRVTSERIYINPFPFFIGFDQLSVTGRDGEGIVSVQKARLYIGLAGLLSREVDVSVAEIEGLRYSADSRSLGLLAGVMAQGPSAVSPDAWKVKVHSILLSRGEVKVQDPARGATLILAEIKARANLKRRILDIRDARLMVIRGGNELISGGLQLSASFSGEGVEVEDLLFRSGESRVELAGVFDSAGFEGSVKTRVTVRKLAELFSLTSDPTGEASAEGRVRWKRGGRSILRGLWLDLKVKGGIFLETLMELLDEEAPLRGFTSFSGRVNGPLLDPVARLEAEMRDGHIYGIDLDSVRCRISYREGEMRFHDGRARLYDGEAEAEVSINLPRVTRYTIKVDAESVDSRAVLRLIKWDPGLPAGKVSGSLHSAGSSFQPEGFFRYTALPYEDGEGVSPLLRRIEAVSGSFKMTGQVVTLTDLRVSSEKTLARAEGSVDLEGDTLQMEARLETEDLADIHGGDLLSGRGWFEGGIEGPVDDPRISGRMELCRLLYRGQPLGCLEASLTYTKRRLWISRLEGRLGDASYSLRGRMETAAEELFTFPEPVFALEGNVSGLDLEGLKDRIRPEAVITRYTGLKVTGAGLEGVLSMDFTIEGPPGDISSSGHIEVEGLMGSQRLSTDYLYRRGAVRFQRMTLRRGGSRIEGDLSVSEEGALSGKGLSVVLLSEDLPWGWPYRFRFRGSLSIGGAAGSPEGELTGGVEMLLQKGGAEGERRFRKIGDIRLVLKEQRLSLEGDLFNNKAVLSGEMALAGELPWKLRVVMKEGRYDEIVASFLKDVPSDLLLSLRGDVVLSGTSSHLEGRVLLRSLRLTLYQQSFANSEDVLLLIEDSRVEFRSFGLRSGSASLSIEGALDTEKGYGLTVYGMARLDPLKGFVSGLEDVKGLADFVFDIKGGWSTPVVNGGMTLERASLHLEGVPGRLHSVKGYLYVDDNTVVLESLSGRYASGELRLSGVGQLKGWRITGYHLEGSVERMNLNLWEGVSFRLSGSLVLTGRGEATTLVGELRVLRGRFTRTIEWKSWMLSARKAAIKRQGGLLDKVELNVNLYGDRDIMIDNNLVRAPAKIDLVALGTLSEPVLVGRVELTGGKIYFRNNEFDIVNASADFTDPARINPFFEIVADTEVKGYQIHLTLEGYIDQFDLSLSSEPALDEVDIFSLLTVGEFGTGLEGLEGGIGASEAASFLTGELRDTIQERLRRITGVDRIEVETYVSETTGTVGPRVTVSKRILSDRLSVTYTTSIGDTPEQLLRLEFFLSDSVSLVGEQDELGTLGADIKFRLEFR